VLLNEARHRLQRGVLLRIHERTLRRPRRSNPALPNIARGVSTLSHRATRARGLEVPDLRFAMDALATGADPVALLDSPASSCDDGDADQQSAMNSMDLSYRPETIRARA